MDGKEDQFLTRLAVIVAEDADLKKLVIKKVQTFLPDFQEDDE